jgi:leader peptidase (prepilin peptidase) / N-methyltransferase
VIPSADGAIGVGAIGVGVAVGIAVGAVLPRVAYRLSVPAGAAPRTGCFACGHPIPAGPAGWLRVGSWCAGCGARLGPRTGLTLAAASVACGLLAVAVGPAPVLPLFVVLALLGVLLAAIDLSCQRLPDGLVLPAMWASVGLFAVVAVETRDWSTALRAAEGAVVLGGTFLILAILPGAGMGYGDVKLAALLGLYLGWLGWGAVILGALLPWLLNGPVVIALLLTGRVNRKSTVPFGPAMLVGALLAVLCNAALARW